MKETKLFFTYYLRGLLKMKSTNPPTYPQPPKGGFAAVCLEVPFRGFRGKNEFLEVPLTALNKL